MNGAGKIFLWVGTAVAAMSASGLAVDQPPPAVEDYVLGPDDELSVWVLGMEEIGSRPVRIAPGGYVDLPLVGRLQAEGLTVTRLTEEIRRRLKSEMRDPKVSVSIAEYGSQPVSVLGAVNTPGVHQLRGRRTLSEILSLAGGLKPDAGPYIRITRGMERGALPLAAVRATEDGKFQVGEVRVKEFLEAKNPGDNIVIRPHDVVTVPTAQLVYVIGAVRKPGGFVLNEKERLTALQALSLAEGLGATPAPKSARILRPAPGKAERTEIAVDLKRILEGKAEDVALFADDILFVPTSAGKRAALRAAEAAIYVGSGMLIWR